MVKNIVELDFGKITEVSVLTSFWKDQIRVFVGVCVCT